MPHALQDRFSSLLLAKLRKTLVLKDGVVFNNDYEGSPKAGAVKIPVRDTEVSAGDYDKANGKAPGTGTTSYQTLTIDKDKAVNEIIDGYDAQAVPDNIVAERLDSAGYALASVIDNDGASCLIAQGGVKNFDVLTKDTVYAAIVDVRTAMSKANVPNDGKRYILCTPDFYALVLKSPEFTSASNLGDEVKKTGALGRIAGFNVYEWNDATAGLQFIAGHPKFATRANEFSVPVKLVSLDGDANYIGASAVKGRMVYAHKVLRSAAVTSCYAPAALGVTCAAGSVSGKTVATVTGVTEGASLKYRVSPTDRAKYGDDTTTGYTDLTSGTTAITAAETDIIEVVEIDSNGKVVKAGYATAVPKA